MTFTFDSFPFQQTATSFNPDGSAFEVDCQAPAGTASIAIQGVNNSPTELFTAGVFGLAETGVGVVANSSSGAGLAANSSTGPGILAQSGTGVAVTGSSASGNGVSGQPSAPPAPS